MVRRLVLSAAAAVLAVALSAAPSPSTAASGGISGKPRVESGDQFRLGRTRIQLYGLDAPEFDQCCENEYGRPFRCGMMAYDALQQLVGRSSVNCLPEGKDEFGNTLAICYVGDMNLNSRMVRTGWAVARGAQRPDYEPLERLAKREKAGIWKFIFDDPADWRAENQ